MLKFLRSNSPVYYFVLSGTLIPLLVFNHYYSNTESELVWPILNLVKTNKITLYLIYSFVVFITSLRLNLIVNKSVFFEKSNYSSGILYFFFMGLSGMTHLAILPAIGNLLVVFSLENFFKIFRNKSCKIEIFNASCFLILSCFFYAYNIFLLPILWLVLYFIRPFQWREYVMPVIALIFISAYLLPLVYFNDSFNSWITVWWNYSKTNNLNNFNEWGGVFFSICFGLIIGLSTLIFTFIKSNNRYKKIAWIIMSLLFLCLIQLLICKLYLYVQYPLFFTLLLPLSILLSNSILNSKYSWLVGSYLVILVIVKLIISFVL